MSTVYKRIKQSPAGMKSTQSIGRSLRSKSEFDYDIVHEGICGKSELDLGNGYHLCKKANIIPNTIELKHTDILEKISEHRPDLLVASDSVRIQGIPLQDVIDGSYLRPREDFLDRFLTKPMDYKNNLCCSD